MAYYADVAKMRTYTPSAAELGVVPFDVIVTVASTQIDDAQNTVINLMGPFPSFTELACAGEWVVTVSDVDTNATPAFVFDLQISSALAGTSPTVLISDSATGQSGAADYLDAVSANGTDLSGKYLQLKIETASATAAAGTIRVQGFISHGPINRAFTLVGVAAV